MDDDCIPLSTFLRVVPQSPAPMQAQKQVHQQQQEAEEERKDSELPRGQLLLLGAHVQVRLQVETDASVRVLLRLSRPSPPPEDGFSLTELQQAIEACFPSPLSPEQLRLVQTWQRKAQEQADTVQRLRQQLDSSQTHLENVEERCAELLRQLRRFEARQLTFEGLHASIVPTVHPKTEMQQLRGENRVCGASLPMGANIASHMLRLVIGRPLMHSFWRMRFSKRRPICSTRTGFGAP